MTDIKETLAKWEAEIEGWELQDNGWLRCTGECKYHPEEKVKAAHAPTPHDDYGAGTNWWIEQLKLNVSFNIPALLWVAEGVPLSLQLWVLETADSRREACIAAIEAAARAWEAAK